MRRPNSRIRRWYISQPQNDEVVAAHRESRGEVHFFQVDFFEKDWAGNDPLNQYDLVYDYTVRRYSRTR
jgi:hypothetical protein